MRILVATDAWRPQVNGVVHTLERLAESVEAEGSSIVFLTPDGFATAALPTYAEIRLAFATQAMVAKRIEAAKPDHVHIATEGPIGWATRRYCRKRRLPFTTSFHTKLPEYVEARIGLPSWISYMALRNFHEPAGAVMAPTEAIIGELKGRGFKRLALWSRGVDHARFFPRRTSFAFKRPMFLSVGRVAVEKNLEAFLRLDLPGSKIVVGDGPARAQLAAAYPDAQFLGAKFGDELADLYAAADVFVFPSKTDTFGNVMIEAMASGAPVAAFPDAAPADVIGRSGAGALDEDLRAACLAALAIPREKALARAKTFTWARSAKQFLENVRFARRERLPAAG